MINLTHIQSIPINEIGFRIVEDQSTSSTRKLVHSDAEHEVLEGLIEGSKPHIPKEAMSLQHYLLSTPFRYKAEPIYGSRFAAKHELQLFYAALQLQTAMAEVAFHRLNFLRATKDELKVISSRTSFAAKISTDVGIDLMQKSFATYSTQINSHNSYKISQQIGRVLRESNIEAFISKSTRANGANINVLHPNALLNNTYDEVEKSCQGWSCYATQEVVEFKHKTDKRIPTAVFSANDFFIRGAFPQIT